MAPNGPSISNESDLQDNSIYQIGAESERSERDTGGGLLKAKGLNLGPIVFAQLQNASLGEQWGEPRRAGIRTGSPVEDKKAPSGLWAMDKTA